MLDEAGMARYYLCGLTLREWWHLYCKLPEGCLKHANFSVRAKIDFHHSIFDRGIDLQTDSWLFLYNQGNICLTHCLEQVSITLHPLDRVQIKGNTLLVSGHEIYF